MKTKKFKVIGAGGIGSHLLEPLARYLSYKNDRVEITVIDGDDFETRNRERQRCTEDENKAKHIVRAISSQFPKLHFRVKTDFITEDNVISLIRERDIVMLCVDNHATRKLISDRCEELNDVVLISGGNDYTDGNVMYYCRIDGKGGRPITEVQPSIANPEDKNPGTLTDEERQGCQEEARSNPQLLFTNLTIAAMMLNVYYAHEEGNFPYEQVYVDILQQRMKPSPD